MGVPVEPAGLTGTYAFAGSSIEPLHSLSKSWSATNVERYSPGHVRACRTDGASRQLAPPKPESTEFSAVCRLLKEGRLSSFLREATL